jgi:two-component system, OmpR family, response regulator
MNNDATRRVLVVDDEPSIADAVSIGLRDAGFATVVADDCAAALVELRTNGCDLVVLDVMLPDRSGFDLAEELRADGVATPILFLTARDALDDKLAGLRHGDDYLTKPFLIAELVARVVAVLRRTVPADRDDGEVLRVGDLRMRVEAHTVTRSGQPLRLTATEFRLLEYFMENANRVLSKHQILDEVWGYAFDGDDGVVETYVRYLRRKLDEHGPPMIETVRLVGYVLRTRH